MASRVGAAVTAVLLALAVSVGAQSEECALSQATTASAEAGQLAQFCWHRAFPAAASWLGTAIKRQGRSGFWPGST